MRAPELAAAYGAHYAKQQFSRGEGNNSTQLFVPPKSRHP